MKKLSDARRENNVEEKIFYFFLKRLLHLPKKNTTVLIKQQIDIHYVVCRRCCWFITNERIKQWLQQRKQHLRKQSRRKLLQRRLLLRRQLLRRRLLLRRQLRSKKPCSDVMMKEKTLLLCGSVFLCLQKTVYEIFLLPCRTPIVACQP
jgi:hypothetical protein